MAFKFPRPLKPNIWTSFPHLETPRLNLREMIPLQDESDLYQFWGDPEVCQYTDFYFDSKSTIKQILISLSQRFNLKQGIRWGITLKSDDSIIGTIGFNTWKTARECTAEIGYDLHKDYWRKGFMFEALQKVVTYGFTQMRVHRIEAQTDPNNIVSRRLLEKVGFVFEGTLRDNAYYKNSYHTSCLYSLLNSDIL